MSKNDYFFNICNALIMQRNTTKRTSWLYVILQIYAITETGQ